MARGTYVGAEAQPSPSAHTRSIETAEVVIALGVLALFGGHIIAAVVAPSKPQPR